MGFFKEERMKYRKLCNRCFIELCEFGLDICTICVTDVKKNHNSHTKDVVSDNSQTLTLKKQTIYQVEIKTSKSDSFVRFSGVSPSQIDTKHRIFASKEGAEKFKQKVEEAVSVLRSCVGFTSIPSITVTVVEKEIED